MLREEGIQSQNDIYTVNNIGELFRIIRPYDKLVVLSIKAFKTCNFVYGVLNALMEERVEFISLQEEIRFSANNPLDEKYKEYIISVLTSEQKLLKDLEDIYRHHDIKEMKKRINDFSLKLLAETFKNHGVLMLKE